jgi:hypothetical protein
LTNQEESTDLEEEESTDFTDDTDLKRVVSGSVLLNTEYYSSSAKSADLFLFICEICEICGFSPLHS